ncbi:Coq4 family protein [Novosphingobium sp. RD2P27]|uniref:Coq4 family protein n=1 Tax=Novosphingobium kalidii TaxID=3230299 RepID=A0ABV2D032_9SPHN
MSAAVIDTVTQRKDWRTAFIAVRRLLADANDTTQVFRIMRALNASSNRAGYDRLLRTSEGGRIAYSRVELAPRLTDVDYVAQFPAGSVGAAYGRFLAQTGYTAEGLAMISRSDDLVLDAEHPYAWFGRRTRDIHDIWHILTGYRADDPLGEACLVAFSFAQTRGLGWALIAIGAMIQAWRTPGGKPAVRAIWEGYRNGRRASWLLAEDYERLLSEPLDEARKRLGIAPPRAYQAFTPIGF